MADIEGSYPVLRWYEIDCKANQSGFCRSEGIKNGEAPTGAILVSRSKPGLNGDPSVLTFACGGTYLDFTEEKRKMVRNTCSGCPNSPFKGEVGILQAAGVK